MNSNPLEGTGGTTASFGRFHCQEQLSCPPPFELYRARTQGLAGFDRAFAVKVLPRNASGVRPDAAQRLLELASLVTTVRDRRIASVVDCGTSPDGGVYVVTDFAFGATLETLRDHAAAGSVAKWPSLLAHIGSEAAWALAAAHATTPPLVHGALSPTNVLITTRGQIKLVDFGLRSAVLPARTSGGQRNLTAYAAPELLLAGDGSRESDMFALGAVLFELCAGKTPPSALNPRSASDLQRVLSGCVHEALQSALLSLLAADAGKRPTAAQAAEALRAAVVDVSETEVRSQLSSLARKVTSGDGSSARTRTRRPSQTNKINATAPVASAPATVTPAPPAVLPTARSAAPAPMADQPPRPEVRPPARVAPAVPSKTLPLSALFPTDGSPGAIPTAPAESSQTAELPPSEESLRLSVALSQAAPVDHDAAPEAIDEVPSGMIEALSDEEISQLEADTVSNRNPALPAAAHPTPAGGTPVSRRAHAAPNMDNLSNSEVDALFSAQVSDAPATVELASIPVTSAGEDAGDFTEDVDTAFFVRGKVFAAETPAQQPRPTTQGRHWLPSTLPPPPAAEAAVAAMPSAAEPAPEVATPAFAIDDAEPLEIPRRRMGRVVLVAMSALLAAGIGIAYVGWSSVPAPATAPADVAAAPAAAPTRARATNDEPPAASPIPPAAAPVAAAEAPAKPAPPPAPATVEAAPTRAEAAPAKIAAPAPATDEGGFEPAPLNEKGRPMVEFVTDPPGATVWINGGERGQTPITLPLRDRHRKLALVRAGHAVVIDELPVDRLPRRLSVSLSAVPPTAGDAQIAVECETSGKYPISIDGHQTGLLCPATLSVSEGEHTVEIYVPWRFKSYPVEVNATAGKTRTVSYPK